MAKRKKEEGQSRTQVVGKEFHSKSFFSPPISIFFLRAAPAAYGGSQARG